MDNKKNFTKWNENSKKNTNFQNHRSSAGSFDFNNNTPFQPYNQTSKGTPDSLKNKNVNNLNLKHNKGFEYIHNNEVYKANNQHSKQTPESVKNKNYNWRNNKQNSSEPASKNSNNFTYSTLENKNIKINETKEIILSPKIMNDNLNENVKPTSNSDKNEVKNNLKNKVENATVTETKKLLNTNIVNSDLNSSKIKKSKHLLSKSNENVTNISFKYLVKELEETTEKSKDINEKNVTPSETSVRSNSDASKTSTGNKKRKSLAAGDEHDSITCKKSKVESKGNAPASVIKSEETPKMCNFKNFNLSENVTYKVNENLKNNTEINSEKSQCNKKNGSVLTTKNTNWKFIEDLSSKLKEANKAIKSQKLSVEKIKKECESEMKKLNEMINRKTLIKTKLDNILNDLKKDADTSEDDDEEEKVEHVDKASVIIVDSSSEDESESSVASESSVEIIEMKESTKPEIITYVAKESNSKTPSSNIDDSFQLFIPNSALDPTLDTIMVNKGENAFITDLKIYNHRLFVADFMGLLRQYDMKSQECVQEYLGHKTTIYSIFPTATPFGERQLFSGGNDNKIMIHNIDSANMGSCLDTTSPIMSICEANEMVCIGTSTGIIYVYSLRGQCFKKEFSVHKDIVCINSVKEALKTLVFVGSSKGEISVWHAESQTHLKDISVQDHVGVPIGFVTLKKQRLLVYSKSNIHFIYYASEKSPVTCNHFSKNSSLCLTKNYVIIGNSAGSISVYRVKGSTIYKTPMATYCNTDSSILSLTFYNNTIISGDKSGKVYFNRLIEMS